MQNPTGPGAAAPAEQHPTPSVAPTLQQLKERTWRPVYRPEHFPEDEFGPAGTWHWIAMPYPDYDLVRRALALRYPAVPTRMLAWTVDQQRPRMILASVRRGGQLVAVAVGYGYEMTPWLHLVAPHLRDLIKPVLKVSGIHEVAALPLRPPQAKGDDRSPATPQN